MALFHPFSWLSNIPLTYIYHILFIYSSVDGHFDQTTTLKGTITGNILSQQLQAHFLTPPDLRPRPCPWY